MKFSIHFLESKPKWVEWLYLLVFAIGLLIAVPFIAMGIISEITVFFGQKWISWLKDLLDIEFDL